MTSKERVNMLREDLDSRSVYSVEDSEDMEVYWPAKDFKWLISCADKLEKVDEYFSMCRWNGFSQEKVHNDVMEIIKEGGE